MSNSTALSNFLSYISPLVCMAPIALELVEPRGSGLLTLRWLTDMQVEGIPNLSFGILRLFLRILLRSLALCISRSQGHLSLQSFVSFSNHAHQVGKCCPQGRYFSPLFLQRVRWGSFILWMLIGASQVSILFSLFFCLHLFRVFFRQDACLNVFCCISIQNQVFLLHKLGVVVECFSYSCAYTLYNVYLFIIKKRCWLPDTHLLFSMKMVFCFVVVFL